MSLGDFYNKVQSYAKVGQNVKGQDSYNMHYECWANPSTMHLFISLELLWINNVHSTSFFNLDSRYGGCLPTNDFAACLIAVDIKKLYICEKQT